MFEDEQLNTELLLSHVQETCELRYWHGGVELQEAARTHHDLDGTNRHTATTFLETMCSVFEELKKEDAALSGYHSILVH